MVSGWKRKRLELTGDPPGGNLAAGPHHKAKDAQMIRDTLRCALAIAVMAAGSALLVETRYQIAAIDVAHRQCLGHQAYAMQLPQPQPSGRLRQFGRATLELADAALGIIR